MRGGAGGRAGGEGEGKAAEGGRRYEGMTACVRPEPKLILNVLLIDLKGFIRRGRLGF